MKVMIKAKDIDQILKGVAAIGSEGRSMVGMYSATDLGEVIHRLEFIKKANDNVGIYSPNGPTHSWAKVTSDIEVSYEEFTVIVAILRMARNVFEKKELWEGFH